MSQKKIMQLIILNTAIVAVNAALFSKAVFGLELFAGTALSISLAWAAIVVSGIVFIKGNSDILRKRETHSLTQSIHSLDDCVAVFKEAIHNGDVFDQPIEQNIDQIARFKRKHSTLKDILRQKFSVEEISYQKFTAVLRDVEDVVYMNMRSILNKISAFDVAEYEALARKGLHGDRLSQEKWDIYNEYIHFVQDATRVNEDILLKMDRMLLEISRYNSLEDIEGLPAILEMDELIQNAKRYQ
jgi:hypothetical protein